jgi:DNA-binding response OmpR family regulator
MADPKEGDPKKRPLIADLLFDDDDDEPGTVPSLDVSSFGDIGAVGPDDPFGSNDRYESSGSMDPPTQPIDLSGFQELPLPMPLSVPLPEPPLYSPPVKSLPPMSSPLAKELSGRNSGIRVLPPVLLDPARTTQPPVSSSPPPLSSRHAPPIEKAPVVERAPNVERVPIVERAQIVERAPPVPSSQPFAALLQEEKATPKATSIPIALPASVLVIDDDQKAGALIASRLLELGYTCRAVRWENARSAIEESRYDAAIAEVSADDVRLDGGRGRAESLGGSSPAVVLTSSAVFRLEHLRELRNVAAAITKPFFVEVLVQSIESARAKTPAAPRSKPVAERSVAERSEPQGDERRTAERHELDVNVVRATITGGPDQGAVRGRVRNLSLTGGLMIESSSKINAKTAITAELTLYDGRMLSFGGRIVRAGQKQEVALKLDADDAQQRTFLQRFLDDARSPDGRALQPVRILVKDESASGAALDETALMKRWLEVSERLDEDDVQQRFIQDCLRAEKLEFAVARYRDLKNARPDDERVAKYLLQLGTILSFKAFGKKDLENAPAKMPGSLKIVIGFFVLAAIALLFVLVKVMNK